MPVVHFIGELSTGSGFKGTVPVFCRWSISAGDKQWVFVDGEKEGRSWISERSEEGDVAIWNDPLDLCFQFKGVYGWPQILVEVFSVDQYKRYDLIGYGTCYLPSETGEHKLAIPCFRPSGTYLEEVQARFLGGTPVYHTPHNLNKGDSRFGHATISTGEVHLSLSTAIKDLPAHVHVSSVEVPLSSPCDSCGPSKNHAEHDRVKHALSAQQNDAPLLNLKKTMF
jgi:B9 domain-containing protein 2